MLHYKNFQEYAYYLIKCCLCMSGLEPDLEMKNEAVAPTVPLRKPDGVGIHFFIAHTFP